MDLLKVIWKEVALTTKETLECSLVGEKVQVDFCLNIEDSTDTSSPSQNSNKMIVKQKESRNSQSQKNRIKE